MSFSPAQRYASASTNYGHVSVSVCVPLCLSQVGVLSKRINESSWFLASRLLSTYPTQRYIEIRVPPKIRVLPSRTLPQTLDLKKRHDRLIVEMCYQLNSTEVNAHSVINWTVVGQLS